RGGGDAQAWGQFRKRWIEQAKGGADAQCQHRTGWSGKQTMAGALEQLGFGLPLQLANGLGHRRLGYVTHRRSTCDGAGVEDVQTGAQMTQVGSNALAANRASSARCACSTLTPSAYGARRGNCQSCVEA